jgi:membrane associated rhomboid family serine protease
VLPIRDLNPTRRTTVVTWVIIAVAAAVYFFVQPHDAAGSTEFLYEQATIPCEIESGEALTVGEIRTGRCGDDTGPQFDPGKRVYLSLVVAMFLHGGIAHLVGNLWMLGIFGNNVEDEMGSVAFIAFYLGAGLAASIGHVLAYPGDTTPVVGASGAIAGVMGAYLVFHPWARVVSIVPPLFFLPFAVPAVVFLGLWFALQFSLADADTNIAWQAHVVGFAFGALVALALRLSGRVRPVTG